MQIQVRVGNIVKQSDVQALVNSANANLRLGSGVAGAIHTAAGPELERYCQPHAPLAYGDYLVTPGFKLPNPWVIHVRAASYNTHDNASELLRSAVAAALRAAHDQGISRIAIPAIGTGVFAFPPELAAQIMANSLAGATTVAPHLELVRVCLFSEPMRELFANAFEAVGLHTEC